MNQAEALTVWAPEGSPWSRWTKPVLFSFMPEEISDSPSPGSQAAGLPLRPGIALLIDLAGADGIEQGIAAARSSYRPIPLYNACPYPFAGDLRGEEFLPASAAGLVDPRPASRRPCAVEVRPIIQALARETSSLKDIPLPLSAPPAFLLDADRHRPGAARGAWSFDNRSMVRQTDLPSAAFLRGQGIQEILVVQARPELPNDLRAVLLAWQEGGLTMARQNTGTPWSPTPWIVPRPSRLKAWWDHFCLNTAYRPTATGSFGRYTHGSAG